MLAISLCTDVEFKHGVCGWAGFDIVQPRGGEPGFHHSRQNQQIARVDIGIAFHTGRISEHGHNLAIINHEIGADGAIHRHYMSAAHYRSQRH